MNYKMRICREMMNGFTVAAIFTASLVTAYAEEKQRKPNVILIFTDDQGYNDLGCFGSKNIKTPHLDKMAAEGKKFTSFMVPSSVCTPSRAGLLTGCYPKRVSMHKGVLFPQSKKGLNPSEYTIADHFKVNGYATACIGKWHLGHHKEVLPNSNGFDYYYGIPYSNDMNHPVNKGKPRVSSDALWKDQKTAVTLWKTPLVENDKIIELPVDQRTITRRCTDKAVEFIDKQGEKPFFLYIPHSMPHIPLYVPEDAFDPDPRNAYKCVIEHIDMEIGRIFKVLKDKGLEKNTIVVFTTDNGPWLSFKNHGGSAFPLRQGKMTTFEGGQRVPCIMWAPGRIPAGSNCGDLASTIDLLPTFATLTKTELKNPHKIDGLDLSETVLKNTKSKRTEFLYYSMKGDLDGIRQGNWKYLKSIKRRKGYKGKPTAFLFNVEGVPTEQENLIKQKPELAQKLLQRMKELDAEIQKNQRKHWKLKD